MKGTTSVIISMNAFLLITIVVLFKVLQPEDPAMYEQFRTQIRTVYLISFLLGNALMLYFYKSQQREIKEELEEKQRLKEEEKMRRREARKKRAAEAAIDKKNRE